MTDEFIFYLWNFLAVVLCSVEHHSALNSILSLFNQAFFKVIYILLYFAYSSMRSSDLFHSKEDNILPFFSIYVLLYSILWFHLNFLMFYSFHNYVLLYKQNFVIIFFLYGGMKLSSVVLICKMSLLHQPTSVD